MSVDWCSTAVQVTDLIGKGLWSLIKESQVLASVQLKKATDYEIPDGGFGVRREFGLRTIEKLR